ncbi:hypothetical protein C8J56DRAFT_918517 [Mycena floridula]|nr:hypothetical protein C8J56DRAFT_918517 [Mycena floridula]
MLGSSLKRTHSAMGEPVTPLPKLNDADIVLQIFTDPSLRRNNADQFNDNERISTFGASVLENVVTGILFKRRPMLKAEDIRIQRKELLSDENYEHWVTVYGLRRRLRYHPDATATLTNPENTKRLFHAYVGGVYSEHGLPKLQTWIHRLLNPDEEIVGEESPAGPPKKMRSDSEPQIQSWPHQANQIFFARQQQPVRATPTISRPMPPHMLSNPMSPAQPSLAFLPLFNQTATQRRVSVDYHAEFNGPAHAGRWTVTCIVAGIPKGVGYGASKQIAKEEAARQAYYSMGWT